MSNWCCLNVISLLGIALSCSVVINSSGAQSQTTVPLNENIFVSKPNLNFKSCNNILLTGITNPVPHILFPVKFSHTSINFCIETIMDNALW